VLKRKSNRYGLSGYRGLSGQGIEDGHENNRFFKFFDLVPHDRLLTKFAATGVNVMVVEGVKEFLLRSSQRFRVRG